MSRVIQWLGVAYRWVSARKRGAAKLVLFASGGFEAIGMREVSVPLLAFAAWLDGAGRARSDNEVKSTQ